MNSNASVDPLNIGVDGNLNFAFFNQRWIWDLLGLGQVEKPYFVNEGATAVQFDALTEEDMKRVVAEAACINEDGSPKKDCKEGDNDYLPRTNSFDTEMSAGLNADNSAAVTLPEVIGANSMLTKEPSEAVGVDKGEASLLTSSKLSGFSGVPRYAVTQVVPASGTIEPGETVTVTVKCQGGTNPQRVRGTLRVHVGSAMKEVDPMPDQYLSFRCEVQAPKTVMYPMAVDVGKVYVGVPVYFEVTTENICNLPAAYKLERPGGPCSAYKLIFDRPEGPLGPKEKITVKAEFTALQPGVIDSIANKIREVAAPLSFYSLVALRRRWWTPCTWAMDDTDATVCTTSASRMTTMDGPLPMPEPLAHPSCARFRNNGDPPSPLPHPWISGQRLTL